ncbi:MAG: phenylacetate--CoA ligase family protein [Oscillospiraceae bacterium]|nr:phenylacetate--CoA ligase family protein [Oscillospiraceae bacterium]
MSYASDRKMENLIMLQMLPGLEKKPPQGKHLKRVKELQDKRVHELMLRAYDIPFYRKRFEQTGTTPADYQTAEDLYKFPVLTKEQLRDWMDQELEGNPEKYKHWHVNPTSGSTGIPLRTLFSPRENAAVHANWLRVLMMGGFIPGVHKNLHRPNSLHTVTGGKKTLVQKAVDLRWKEMSDSIKNRVPSQQLLKEINDYKPYFLYTHKNVLVRVAKYAKEHNIPLHQPKLYAPISEMLDHQSEQLLLEMFGPGLLNAYGLSEVGSCATRLPGSKEFIVNSDTHVINIYDDEWKPSDSGMAVVTPLFKTDLPIINYETRDRMVSYQKEGIRFITTLLGRMNDVIRHKDGSVTEWGNIEIVVNYSTNLDIVQSRFIQESYELIRIQLVKDPASQLSNQEIEERYTEKFAPVLNNEFRFEYEWMDEIPADPNGKLRMIVCKVK